MAPAARRSAGLLLYRRHDRLEVLLAHMGGPFWARKDAGAWSIPKGLYSPEEDPRTAAYREFAEEIGRPAPPGEALPLGEVRQPSGKLITVFAIEGDLDVVEVASNEFEMEWPPGSGQVRSFPEIDRAEWFALPRAREKLVSGQVPFLDLLSQRLGPGA